MHQQAAMKEEVEATVLVEVVTGKGSDWCQRHKPRQWRDHSTANLAKGWSNLEIINPMDHQHTYKHTYKHTRSKNIFYLYTALQPWKLYKDADKREEICQTVPPSSKLLGLPDYRSHTSMSLTKWVMVIIVHIHNTKMDAIFSVTRPMQCSPWQIY